MPRRGRVIAPGYPHHVVQRGHNRQAVFFTAEDRPSYLATLCEFREKLGMQVYAYCLMTNHVHLIVNPGNDAANLSLLMKRLAGRHTRRLNQLKRRTGTSWEGRFKCSPIESSTYLLACARYVDLNPVRAHIVRRPEDYEWSSYRARIGLSSCPWLDPDPCFLALASTTEQRQQRYREFVTHDIPTDQLAFLRAAVQRNQLTGSDAFILQIEQLTGIRVLSRPPGRPAADKEHRAWKK
jgi:putative transposase